MGANKSKQKVTLSFRKSRVAEMKEAFDLFDVNKNGYISLKELDKIMKRLNQQVDHEKLVRMVSEVDIDKDGVIDFGEFLVMMKRFEMYKRREAEIQEMFNVFDIRKRGEITPEDLKAVMNIIGEETSDEEIAEMMEEADVDQDGVINFEEFVSLCDRLKLI